METIKKYLVYTENYPLKYECFFLDRAKQLRSYMEETDKKGREWKIKEIEVENKHEVVDRVTGETWRKVINTIIEEQGSCEVTQGSITIEISAKLKEGESDEGQYLYIEVDTIFCAVIDEDIEDSAEDIPWKHLSDLSEKMIGKDEDIKFIDFI